MQRKDVGSTEISAEEEAFIVSEFAKSHAEEIELKKISPEKLDESSHYREVIMDGILQLAEIESKLDKARLFETGNQLATIVLRNKLRNFSKETEIETFQEAKTVPELKLSSTLADELKLFSSLHQMKQAVLSHSKKRVKILKLQIKRKHLTEILNSINVDTYHPHQKIANQILRLLDLESQLENLLASIQKQKIILQKSNEDLNSLPDDLAALLKRKEGLEKQKNNHESQAKKAIEIAQQKENWLNEVIDITQRTKNLVEPLKTQLTRLDLKIRQMELEKSYRELSSEQIQIAKSLQQQEEIKDYRPKRQQFLYYVSVHDLEVVETMLEKDPWLACVHGTVVEYDANRVFSNITGFQYALWALDSKMCNVILSHLSFKDAKTQLDEWSQLENPSWGRFFDWKPLLLSLKKYDE